MGGNSITIGCKNLLGLGHVDEFDRSCFGKRKYERGRLTISEQWIFGGIH